MTTRELVRKANNLFNIPYVPQHIQRHNRHQWVRSVQRLGDKWLLATPVERKTPPN